MTRTISTNKRSTISINVTRSVPINFDDKKIKYKMDCYILHTFLLKMISLFLIAIICYHYTKHKSKQKRMDNIKMENNELKKFVLLKIPHVIISMT